MEQKPRGEPQDAEGHAGASAGAAVTAGSTWWEVFLLGVQLLWSCFGQILVTKQAFERDSA
jgi:hypothetical protein